MKEYRLDELVVLINISTKVLSVFFFKLDEETKRFFHLKRHVNKNREKRKIMTKESKYLSSKRSLNEILMSSV